MKKKILLVPGYTLYPFTNGGSIAQMTFVDSLQNDFDFTIIISDNNVSEKYFSELKRKWESVEFKYFKQTSVNTKTSTLIKTLRFLKKKIIKKESSIGFSIPDITSNINIQLIEYINKAIKTINPDIIQIEMTPNILLINSLDLIKKPIVFVNHELLSEKVETEIKESKLNTTLTTTLLKNVSWFEKSACNEYDYILCFNDINKEYLKNIGVTKPIFTSPFPIFEKDIKPINSFDDEITHFSFIGSEHHHANKHALIWLIKNIMPKLSNRNVNLHLKVTGAWSNEFKKTYHHKNVNFVGFVDSVDSILKKSILLSPINIGSGLRTKIIMAMAKAIPVIATTFAVSGINGVNKKHYLISDTPEHFVSDIILLINNRNLLKALRENAFLFIKNNFNQKKLTTLRKKIYTQIIESYDK